jgi:radial spoke head protein 4A
LSCGQSLLNYCSDPEIFTIRHFNSNHDNELFAWAGITFGKENSYLLQKSIKVLAASTQAQSIRFFGKITALTGDYYIVEATVEGGEGEGDGENADPTVEAAGTGVNKYTYFVTMNPFQKWNKLPNLTPSILATARKISYLLKGDLEAKIYSNPVFLGKKSTTCALKSQGSPTTRACCPACAGN